ncbi:hypothetical protein M9458_001222, partial [Cirrhinus mrigala]
SVRLKSTLSTFFDEVGKAGIILKSASIGIFENLALEDWIHDHVDLQNRSMLLLWRNSPVVVIGRHQNPWQECNLPLMRRLGIPLARRRSGGGTVFHDFGNINMTFFTSKKKYDRHRNLKVVTSALKALRPDLDSNTSEVIKSNATPSVPSPVKNLLDVDPTLDSSTIMDAIASQYNNEFGFDGPVITVDPTHEALMPGIHKMAQDLQTWEWIYGRTPKFSVCTSLVVDDVTIQFDMDIKNGTVEQCAVEIPEDWLSPEMVNEFTSTLNGSKYCPNETAVLVAAFMRTHSMTGGVAEKIHRL